jgi:hypothetical protein
MISLITLAVKSIGERSAGNPHAAFDVAGTGNVEQAIVVILALANESASAQENRISPKPARQISTLPERGRGQLK